MAAWACASCGGENPEGMRFCGHCGTPAPADWTCASCAGENPPGTRFCGHCGAPAAAAPAAHADAAPPPAPRPVEDASETLRSFVTTQVADRLVEGGGELPQERRLITALFADVSGFTALADRLDPEQLLEVIDPVVSALSSVVGRYEGYVEKFAGDALLALFGAPVAHEDDAARALDVALEMHEQLARVCAELGPEASGLTLHVGVNSGHGIARILGSEARMDYAVLGDSVILAQRLESAAPPRETYVSELTVRLTRDEFEFEPIGELTLKGKVEPVPAWRLVGRKPKTQVETPRRLVGRARELAAIDETLASLAGGRGAIVTVAGEPGVGKSRLTAEVRRRATERGVRWLETRCLAYGRGLAYWPFAQLLRSVAGISPEDGPAQAAAMLASAPGVDAAATPFFARLLDLPLEDDGAGELEPEAFRRGLHDAFGAWLRRLAVRAPVVLAVEDVHWADASSLALVHELARLASDAPLALYVIARPEGATAMSEIADGAPGVGRLAVEVAPLGEEAVAALVAELLGAVPPARLVPAVAGRTAGNPFFVEETVRSLQDRGELTREDGRWLLSADWDADALPPTVEGLLAARIDLLPRPAGSLLGTASVVGRRMRVELLGTVAAAAIDEPLQAVVAGGFLDRYDEDGHAGVAFHHALVQDVAYSRLLRKQRRDLHRRVAEAAEALYGSGDDVVDLLARHLYLGEAGPKAVEFLVRAGARAKRLFANDEAIAHLTRALELASDDQEIALELADLHELVGGYEHAARLYEGVRAATGDVRAWGGLAATLRKRGRYEDALALLDEAFRTEALAGADLAPLWLEQGWTLSVAGRFDQAIDVLEAGLAAADGRDDLAIGHMLLQLARAETIEGRFAEALQHGTDAERLFERLENQRGMATAQRIVGDVHRRQGRLDDAARSLRRGLELAEQVGNAEEVGGCLINLGLVELERGAFEDAIACNARAIEEFERIGHATGEGQATANLAWTLTQGGRHDEAIGHAQRALAIGESLGHSMMVADVHDTLGWIELRRGDYSRAAEQAKLAVERYAEIGATPSVVSSLELVAEAYAGAGDVERAAAARARAGALRDATRAPA